MDEVETDDIKKILLSHLFKKIKVDEVETDDIKKQEFLIKVDEVEFWNILFNCFFLFSKIDGTQVQGTPVEPHKRTNFFPGDKTLSDEDLFNIQRLENRFCYFYQFSFLVFGGMVKY